MDSAETAGPIAVTTTAVRTASFFSESSRLPNHFAAFWTAFRIFVIAGSNSVRNADPASMPAFLMLFMAFWNLAADVFVTFSRAASVMPAACPMDSSVAANSAPPSLVRVRAARPARTFPNMSAMDSPEFFALIETRDRTSDRFQPSCMSCVKDLPVFATMISAAVVPDFPSSLSMPDR